MRHPVYAIVVALTAIVMAVGLLQLPAPGAPDSPVQRYASVSTIDAESNDDSIRNRVTAVLLDYRSLDTFGEVTVIFSALLGVLIVAAANAGAAPPETRAQTLPDRLPPSPVVDFVVRLMAPFLAAFAAFVMVSGDLLPGGGFQGSVVLGAMAILLAVAIGRPRVEVLLRQGMRFWVRAAAPLTFAVLALVGLVAAGWWFALPEPAPLRHALLVLLDFAIGVGGAAVLIGIFFALARD